MSQMLDEQMAIPYSKAKLVSLALLALMMLVCSAYVIIVPSVSVGRSSALLQVLGSVAGGVGVVMFGGVLPFVIVKLFDRAPGLVIDSGGFIDRTHMTAAGRVEWTNVRALRVFRTGIINFLFVDLHDPRPVVRRGNAAQRLVMAANMRFPGGSAVCLLSSMLDIRFSKMTRVARQYFDQAKGIGSPPLSSGGGGV